MKTIPLTKGYVALVDDADYERVMVAGPWQAMVREHTVYARHSSRNPDERRSLHRFVLGITAPRVHVDHADGNGLNNQRENLRACTPSQNRANSAKRQGVSKFKGVTWREARKRWCAEIFVNGKRHRLGSFHTEAEAAASYRAAAQKHFGTFAKFLKRHITAELRKQNRG